MDREIQTPREAHVLISVDEIFRNKGVWVTTVEELIYDQPCPQATIRLGHRCLVFQRGYDSLCWATHRGRARLRLNNNQEVADHA